MDASTLNKTFKRPIYSQKILVYRVGQIPTSLKAGYTKMPQMPEKISICGILEQKIRG